MHVANEFQRRRRQVTRFAIPWVVVGVAGCLLSGLFLAGKDSQEILMIGFLATAMGGGLIGVVLYRCPSCNKVPNEDGILFDPVSCPTCGAKLK